MKTLYARSWNEIVIYEDKNNAYEEQSLNWSDTVRQIYRVKPLFPLLLTPIYVQLFYYANSTILAGKSSTTLRSSVQSCTNSAQRLQHLGNSAKDRNSPINILWKPDCSLEEALLAARPLDKVHNMNFDGFSKESILARFLLHMLLYQSVIIFYLLKNPSFPKRIKALHAGRKSVLFFNLTITQREWKIFSQTLQFQRILTLL